MYAFTFNAKEDVFVVDGTKAAADPIRRADMAAEIFMVINKCCFCGTWIGFENCENRLRKSVFRRKNIDV